MANFMLEEPALMTAMKFVMGSAFPFGQAMRLAPPST
jgi:hypothetical protein